MEISVCGLAVALGIFIAACPARAAEIWGSEKLRKLAPEYRASFFRWYRAFGILLFLADATTAIDNIVFSNYHH
jgi:hypothetical protein